MARYGKQQLRTNMEYAMFYMRMPKDTHARIKDISEKTCTSMSHVIVQMLEYALEHVQVDTVEHVVKTSTLGFYGGSKHV